MRAFEYISEFFVSSSNDDAFIKEMKNDNREYLKALKRKIVSKIASTYDCKKRTIHLAIKLENETTLFFEKTSNTVKVSFLNPASFNNIELDCIIIKNKNFLKKYKNNVKFLISRKDEYIQRISDIRE